ncbi:MAG: hypothetical protein WD424_08335, partial [Paenibacillaceae bacterium]
CEVIDFCGTHSFVFVIILTLYSKGEYLMLKELLPYLGLIGVIVGVVLNHFIDSKKTNNIKNSDRKIAAYYELTGIKIIIPQQYYSCYEAQITHEMHKHKWILEGADNNSFDKEQTIFWMNKANDRNEQLANSLRLLYEKLGSARIAFSKNEVISEKIDTIIMKPLYQELSINIQPENVEEIKNWGESTLIKIKEIANKRYGQPLDELLDYMKKDLKI